MSAQDPLLALGREVAARLDEGQPARLARQRARLLAPRPSPRRVAPMALVAAGLALALAGVLSLRRPLAPPAIRATALGGEALAEGAWLSAGSAPKTVQFNDGSTVALEPGATLRVVSLTPRGAELAVERGAARVDVRHREGARWFVRAGPWTVEVTGTAFTVGWSPGAERMQLAMIHGSVRVHGPRVASRAVVAGERVVADPRQGLRAALEAPPSRVEEAALALARVETLHPAVPLPTRPRRSVRSPRVVTSAEVRAAPSAPAAAVTIAPAVALAAEADRARYDGRVSDARTLLLTLRQRHPGTPEAHRAAYHLGVLALEAQRAPSVAASWFQISLREAPHGPLRRECMGRRIQALHAAGDVAAARSAAELYLRDDPDGAFAPFARDVLRR